MERFKEVVQSMILGVCSPTLYVVWRRQLLDCSLLLAGISLLLPCSLTNLCLPPDQLGEGGKDKGEGADMKVGGTCRIKLLDQQPLSGVQRPTFETSFVILDQSYMEDGLF